MKNTNWDEKMSNRVFRDSFVLIGVQKKQSYKLKKTGSPCQQAEILRTATDCGSRLEGIFYQHPLEHCNDQQSMLFAQEV